MDIARTLRDARRGAGLTQRELATRARTSQPAVARYESGAAVPSFPTLDRLLGALGIELHVSPRTSPARRLTGPVGRRLAERRHLVLRVLEAHDARGPQVFGSVARGEDSDDSDLDLLMEMDRPTLVKLAALARELHEVLGVDVDLALPETLRADVLAEARREGVPL